MSATLADAASSLVLALFVGWAVPAWTMKRLLPVLESSEQLVTNYRGRRIPTGLGLVWLVWAAAVALVATAFDHLGVALASPIGVVRAVPVLLVVGAFAFGLTDDLFGGNDAKGFRGHLRAMAKGRLTTGGLKLLGIGVLSLAYGTYAHAARDVSGLPGLAGWILAALVIALSANLVNLTDLRPGRAMKTYVVLALAGVVLYFLRILPDAPSRAFLTAACAGILLLGPVAATWRFDLGERAMLGDAGANAMGALAGFFLSYTSPLWLLAALAAVLLTLNLVSEKVSFSGVIERVRPLRWIDGLGRLPGESLRVVSGQDTGDGERTGGSAATDDEAGKDGGTSNR